MIQKLKSNIDDVLSRMNAAAEKSGRTADDVQLVAVTKYVDTETTSAVVQAGCGIVGESRPQKLTQKQGELAPKFPDLKWHLIGHLQRNKAAKMVACVDLIHSVDSLRLLNSINNAAEAIGKVQDVLLEVNVSGESAKHGLIANDLRPAIESAVTLANVRVCGLMCMAGLGSDDAETLREFESLRELSEAHQDVDAENIQMTELSMGMSGDFEAAIEQGATLVRVGSVLFRGIS